MNNPVIRISPVVNQVGPRISVQPRYTVTLTTRLGDMKIGLGISGGPRGYKGDVGDQGLPGPQGIQGPKGESAFDDPGDLTLLFENRLV